MDTKPAADGPLAGIKVLDLTTMILGPMAAQYLGDMGADVLKIEPPEGDLTRYIGPGRSPGMAAFYLTSNRNKRSVVLDIKKPEGMAVLQRLVERSDVVLHSIRRPSAEKLGLTYDKLAARNPKIILCHVKGYSDLGTYAGRPAYDDVVQAASGLAALQSVVAGTPRYVPSIIADKVAATHAALAMAMALIHRERTGRGQEVEVPMFETLVAFNTVEHLWGAAFEPALAPMGYVPVSQAARRPFQTRDDGYLCVLPYTDAHWSRFCEVVGDPELTADPRWATHAARQSDQPGFWNEVGRRVARRTTQEWIDALTAADVPHGRVNSLEDLLVDPHLESVGFWQTMEHPTEGLLRVSKPPLGFSDSPAAVRRLPPRIGQDTTDVLTELGIDAAEIERLYAQGVTKPKLKARQA